jgi:CxxC motif-containing protein
VPCKTSLPVDKELIFDVLKAIKSSSAPKPIKAGKVLIKNILGTNADIVATSNVY